jgi:hypothetical protein
MEVRLGRYPLCQRCRERNGGLVATRHRQVHVTVGGRESCVDEGLALVMAGVWTVGDTVTCCEDDDGRAYIVAAPGSRDAVAEYLRSLGFAVGGVDGRLSFPLPQPPPAPPAPPIDVDPAGPLPPALAALAAEVGRLRPRFTAATTGGGHPRVREAHDRLADAERLLDVALLRAVSPLRRPDGRQRPLGRMYQLASVVPVTVAVGVVVAWLTDRSVPWLVVALMLTQALVYPCYSWGLGRLERRISRRRVAAARHAGGRGAGPPDGAGSDPGRAPHGHVGHLLSGIRDAITPVRATIGALLVRWLDGIGRPAPVAGPELLGVAARDAVFALVLRAEEELTVAAYSIGVWRTAARG